MDYYMNKPKPKFKPAKVEFVRPNRSNKYHPSYADRLYEHLSSGFSIHTFSLEGIAHTTIMSWVDTNAEFRHALIEGEKKRRLLVEATGMKLLKDGNTVAWKTLLSQYEVVDRVSIEEKKEVKITLDPDSSTPKRLERLERIKELMASLEETPEQPTTIDVTPSDEFEGL